MPRVQGVEEPAAKKKMNLKKKIAKDFKSPKAGSVHQPASYQHSAVSTQLNAANHQGGVSQDASVAELIEVQQHVVGMPRELLHIPISPHHVVSIPPVPLPCVHLTCLCRNHKHDLCVTISMTSETNNKLNNLSQIYQPVRNLNNKYTEVSQTHVLGETSSLLVPAWEKCVTCFFDSK